MIPRCIIFNHKIRFPFACGACLLFSLNTFLLFEANIYVCAKFKMLTVVFRWKFLKFPASKHITTQGQPDCKCKQINTEYYVHVYQKIKQKNSRSVGNSSKGIKSKFILNHKTHITSKPLLPWQTNSMDQFLQYWPKQFWTSFNQTPTTASKWRVHGKGITTNDWYNKT